MRIFLIACVLFLALVTGLLFAAPALVDAARYRSDVEAVAARAAGQPIRINGAMSFRILPTPRLIAENVIIAPPPRHSDLRPLLKASRAEILLSISDLLSGTYTAERVVIADPEIVLHTSLAGHDNLAAGRDGILLTRNLSLQGGTFRYLNEERGRDILVTRLSGTLATEGAFGTRSLVLEGTWEGRESRLSGRLTSSDRPSVSAEVSVGGLGTARLQGRLDMAETWKIDGELGLSTEDLAAVFPDLAPAGVISGVLSANAVGQVTLSPGELLVEGVSGEIGTSAFGGRISLTDGEVPEIDASLSFEQLDGPALGPWVQEITRRAMSGELAAPDSSAVRARLQFDTGLIAFPRGFVRQVSATASYENGVVHVPRFAALLPGGSDFAFSGDVSLSGGVFRLSGKTEFGSDNLAALLEAAAAPIHPGGHGRLRNLGLSAGLLIDSSVAQISDIDLRFDQSRVTGGIAVALVKRPSFSLNLTVDQLNANAYAGLVDTDAAGLPLLQGDPERPSMPLLGAFDTNASIRIGRLIAGGSVARGIELDAGLIGGVLDIKSLAIEDIDGGSLSISGRVDTPENPQWLLNGEVASGTPARLFGGLLGENFPFLSRTGQTLVRFGLEGGPARSAADIEISMEALKVSLTGLISHILADADFDLDASLSASRGPVALQQMFPDWRLPAGIAGPLLAEGTVRGRHSAFEVDGKIDALAARAEVRGRIAGLGGDGPAYGLDVRVRHGDFLQLMETLNAGLIAGSAEPAPLDLGFRVDGDRGRTSFSKIDVRAGNDQATAELELDWAGVRPVATLSVSGGHLRLDKYLGGGIYGASAAVAVDDRALRWSRLPLDWPWMRRLELQASLRLSELSVLGLQMTDAGFDFRAGPDGWHIEGLEAGLGQGTVQATVDAVTRPVPGINLSAAVQAVDLPLLLEPFLGRRHEAEGVVSLQLEARGSGITEYDLVRSLNGRIVLKPGTSVHWPPEVMLNDLQGAIAISDGVARAAPALEGGSGDGSGMIVGSIDIGGWLADLEVRPARAEAGQRLSITGPLHDIRVR